MLNIATQAAAPTAAFHVKGLDGQPLYDGEKPVRIFLYSPGSQAAAVVESRATARAFKRADQNDNKIAPPTAEERRAERAEDLATMTAEFDGFTIGDGKLKGYELFHAVYADPSLGFIAKQAERFLQDWSNFKPASSGG